MACGPEKRGGNNMEFNENFILGCSAIGAGLGLSIVKVILEQHDASYGVFSTPGVGSSLWFELKIKSEE